MSISLLEHIRDELRGSGAIQNTPEFCTGWLGRSEGYIKAGSVKPESWDSHWV